MCDNCLSWRWYFVIVDSVFLSSSITSFYYFTRQYNNQPPKILSRCLTSWVTGPPTRRGASWATAPPTPGPTWTIDPPTPATPWRRRGRLAASRAARSCCYCCLTRIGHIGGVKYLQSKKFKRSQCFVKKPRSWWWLVSQDWRRVDLWSHHRKLLLL